VPETPDEGDIEIAGAASAGSAGTIAARITMRSKRLNMDDALIFIFITC
jgi:hypothetical protein